MHDLNDRQTDITTSQYSIAQELGKWNQGVLGDGAHFIKASAFTDKQIMCGNCIYFDKEAGVGCAIVSGDEVEGQQPIESSDVCKLWVIPNELLEVEQTRLIIKVTS